jgi:hypothetical protein
MRDPLPLSSPWEKATSKPGRAALNFGIFAASLSTATALHGSPESHRAVGTVRIAAKLPMPV